MTSMPTVGRYGSVTAPKQDESDAQRDRPDDGDAADHNQQYRIAHQSFLTLAGEVADRLAVDAGEV